MMRVLERVRLSFVSLAVKYLAMTLFSQIVLCLPRSMGYGLK